MNIIQDLIQLSQFPEKTITNLVELEKICCAKAAYDAVREKKDVETLDLGIGKLNLFIEGTSVRYKFVPKKDLEKMIIEAVQKNTIDPLTKRVEEILSERLKQAYKDLL